ncbi:cobyrinate a,c-diamide synthase [Eubacteriales bacterium KG127]
MKRSRIPRIMLVGTGSGSGKTTATVGMIKALDVLGKKVSSFKCGPDYIDPMFHTEVLGVPAKNIDLFLLGNDGLQEVIGSAENSDIAVIEGVMGMYDGIGFDDDSYSANHIARLTETPEILITSVEGKGRSLLAGIKGYLDFHENLLKGVILNNCSEAMYKVFKPVIEAELSIPCLGYLPKIKEAVIGSRHLGLITAEEIEDLQDRIQVIGETFVKTVDMDTILDIANETEELTYEETKIEPVSDKPIKIAVAKDRAFCFHYRDNLDILRKLGADIEFFSPINDDKLPADIQGIIIGGGYPEIYIDKVMGNESMKESIRKANSAGIPIYAESGGYTYLAETMTFEGKTYEGVGIVPGNITMSDTLVRFGYKTLTAKVDNILCKVGESTRCHEHHYMTTDKYGDSFVAEKPSGKKFDAIHTTANICAGFPCIHWMSNIEFVENFIKECKKRDRFNG